MFAKLEGWFNAFFLGYAARVSGDLAVGLVPVALALVTVYVAIYGLAVMRGEATEPVGTFAWKMAKVGAILSFALPGLYYSANVAAAATGLQDGLAVLFVAPGGGGAATAFGALDLANTAANEQLALLWKDAGMLRLDLVVASLLFSLGTTIFLVLGAFVALLGKLILTFALAIGPLAILFRYIFAIRLFSEVWLLTRGGPSRLTEVLAIYLYKETFQYREFGSASAAGVCMLLLSLAIALPYLIRMAREVRRDG